MLNIKRLCFILCCIFLFTANIAAQNGAQISADELTYNFGTIAEADGLASHTFVVKNTGDSPLVITRITASCGCTQPEWTKAPIAPGKTGNVKVTYNPKGRPVRSTRLFLYSATVKKAATRWLSKGTLHLNRFSPHLSIPTRSVT